METLVYVPRKSVQAYRLMGYEPVPDVRRDWAVLMQYTGAVTQEPVVTRYVSNMSRASSLRLPIEHSQTPAARKQREYRKRKLAEAACS